MIARRITISLFILLAFMLTFAPRAEPLLLTVARSQAEAQSFDERVALVADGLEVLLPQGDGPHPAALLFHGCAGPRMTFQRQWAELFLNAGYAAVIVDSTGPRGMSRDDAREQVCTGQALLGQERAGDVPAALAALSVDTRLDLARPVLAGWSHGGWTIMDAMTMDMATRRPAGLTSSPPGAIDPAGVILVYPHCGLGALSRFQDWETDAPVLALIAGADEVVDAEACIRLFEARRLRGEDITMTVYPGANHVFDDPFLEPEWLHWHDADAHADAIARVEAFLESLRG